MFDKNQFNVTSDGFNAFIGSTPTLFDDDAGIAAIIRAIKIKNGLTLEEKDKFIHETELFCDSVSEEDVMGVFALGHKHAIIYAPESAISSNILPPDGWKTLDGSNGTAVVNNILSNIRPTKVFIKESEKSFIAFVATCTNQRWVRCFEASISKIMPWDFSGIPIDTIKDVSISLANRTSGCDEKFINFVNGLSSCIDFRDIFLEGAMRGIASIAYDRQIESAKSRLGALSDKIGSYEREIARYMSEYAEKTALLKALMAVDKPDDTEIIEFFKKRKDVRVTKREGDIVYYDVTGTLEFYDEDEFVRLYQKERSYLFDNVKKGSDTAKVFWLIFGEHYGEIVVNAGFTLTAMSAVASRGHERIRTDRAPHPHIYFYGCDGGNGNLYSEYAKAGEYQLAVDQSVAATKNINWGDGSVVPRFVEWVGNNFSCPCVTMDGDCENTITINEFIKIAKEEGKWPD